MTVPWWFVVADAGSAALTVAVGAYFAASWRRSRVALHALLAAGFLLTGIGFLGVAWGTFDTTALGSRADVLRLAGRTAGALVLGLAYAGATAPGGPRPWLVLGWVTAALGVLTLTVWLAPPAFAIGTPAAFAVAHATQGSALAWSAAASARGWRAERDMARAAVPAAFAAWAAASFVWLVVDVTGADLVGIAYTLRVTAAVLFVVGIATPGGRRRGVPRAAA